MREARCGTATHGDHRRYSRRSRPRAGEGRHQGAVASAARSARAGGRSAGSRCWRASTSAAALARGRSYARERPGAIDRHRAQGKVKAKVQGSRPKPYDVTIEVKTLRRSRVGRSWSRRCRRQALFAAKLLAGEMPQDIEQVFQRGRAVAVPGRSCGDLKTDCSCPDWSNPCKHIAAVYYLLGEEFDRDPFLLFRLRGLEREELLGRLGTAAPQAAAAPSRWKSAAPEVRGASACRPGGVLVRRRIAGRPVRRGPGAAGLGRPGAAAGQLPLLARAGAAAGCPGAGVPAGGAGRAGCLPGGTASGGC